MIKKLLIANRGEIAARVIATARRMGIATVAVYSDADARAAHVQMADEAVRIGPPAPSESYLDGAKMIAAAQATGADAIHPGYGFLSENPDFVQAVEAAGLTFVGPPASAIRAMGLKDAAKALMEQAGVPVVPGYHGAAQDVDTLAQEAARIGYPVLIKARAGGGGKGMRLVEDAADFAEALQSAQREGQSSFGDPAVLVEKYITKPRHIEIQVFADGHGNVVHLFERDCSLQRRHQKVIEEAPAPDMPPAVRAAMGAAAVEAARAIGYEGAGTVEFVADGAGPLREDGFWFMEMNTRLQVEHPVTEAITGLDLVALQLRVAGGAALPFAQEDLAIDGHAFEARLYAEDAARGFLPATGRLLRFRTPPATAFELGLVRVDAGVREGDEITPHYDPMIAKVIVHGATRAEALARLTETLEAIEIAGSVTNLDFLGALSRHAGFAAGEVDTGLIGRDQEALTAPPAPDETDIALACLGALGLVPPADATRDDPFAALTGWRVWGAETRQAQLSHGEDDLTREVRIEAAGQFRVGEMALRISAEGGALRIDDGTGQSRAQVFAAGGAVHVQRAGRRMVFVPRDPFAAALEAEGGDGRIIAPMPGLVQSVRIAAGASVAKGDVLVVLEAMKMEHALTAPRDGIVAEVLAQPGDQVADGDALIVLDDTDDA